MLVQIIIMYPIPCSFSMSIEGQCILKEVEGEFMRCVDTRAIAQKARTKKIISEAVEKQINESKSLDASKKILFEHLHNQVMLEGLRCFCSIMIESEGYQRMQMFGKELLAKLEKVRQDCTNWFRLCPGVQPPVQPGQLYMKQHPNPNILIFILFSRAASLTIIIILSKGSASRR